MIMSVVRRSLLAPISNEVRVLYAFAYRDFLSCFLPGFLYGAVALQNYHAHHPKPMNECLLSYFYLTMWLCSFTFFATLSTQITSNLDEDRINKPDRPLVSGKSTMFGAKVRWLVTTTVFVSLAISKPTLAPATITWILIIAFLSLVPQGGHWLGKNTIAVPFCVWAEVDGAWNAVDLPTTPQIGRWRLAGVIWASLMIQIQDLRDSEGDRKVGRKTLPIAFGDKASRWIIVLIFEPLAFLVLYLGGALALAPRTSMIGHLVIAYRVVRGGSMKNPRYDNHTYMILLIFASFGAVLVSRAAFDAAQMHTTA